MSDMARTLVLRIVDRTIEIRSSSERGTSLLATSYGHLQVPRTTPDLVYSIEDTADSGLVIRRQATLIHVQRAAELLPYFDDDLVVQLQLLRPDLYFQHAAVVALDERAFLFPAPRGHGKSTLAWALLQHGLRYSSDELGPIDPLALTVAPYSRAICLKKDPPPPYSVPAEFVHDHPILHLPVDCLTQPPIAEPIPLTGVFFPRFDPASDAPRAQVIGPATAAARLYSNALNPLAHPGSGLDAAVAIAAGIPCYELVSSTLPATCEMVLEIMRACSQQAAPTSLL